MMIWRESETHLQAMLHITISSSISISLLQQVERTKDTPWDSHLTNWWLTLPIWLDSCHPHQYKLQSPDVMDVIWWGASSLFLIINEAILKSTQERNFNLQTADRYTLNKPRHETSQQQMIVIPAIMIMWIASCCVPQFIPCFRNMRVQMFHVVIREHQ